MSDNALAEILLDVSDLEPPEPLTRALDTVEQLTAGQYLRMLHAVLFMTSLQAR